MYVALYLFLDKGKIFDGYLSQFYPPEQLASIKIGWNSRVISILNASLITFCGFYSLWTEPENVFENPVMGYPSLAPIFGAFLFAYCLFDLVLVLLYIDDLGDIAIIVHHIMIVAWLFNSGVIAHASFGAGTVFMTNELSTIFLNFRWFFHKILTSPKGSKDSVPSIVVKANLLLFAGSFFVTRVVWNFYMMYRAINQAFFELSPDTVIFRPYGIPSFTYGEIEANVKIMMGILVPLLCVLNLWWFGTIIQKAHEVLTGQSSS